MRRRHLQICALYCSIKPRESNQWDDVDFGNLVDPGWFGHEVEYEPPLNAIIAESIHHSALSKTLFAESPWRSTPIPRLLVPDRYSSREKSIHHHPFLLAPVLPIKAPHLLSKLPLSLLSKHFSLDSTIYILVNLNYSANTQTNKKDYISLISAFQTGAPYPPLQPTLHLHSVAYYITIQSPTCFHAQTTRGDAEVELTKPMATALTA